MLNLPRFTDMFCNPALNEPCMRGKGVRSRAIVLWKIQYIKIIYGCHSCLASKFCTRAGWSI